MTIKTAKLTPTTEWETTASSSRSGGSYNGWGSSPNFTPVEDPNPRGGSFTAPSITNPNGAMGG